MSPKSQLHFWRKLNVIGDLIKRTKSKIGRKSRWRNRRTWNSPPSTDIKRTPTCRIVLTRNWQEVICTKKGIRKSHKELARKEREAIRSGPVLLGGDTEEKGDYMGGDPSWGISIQFNSVTQSCPTLCDPMNHSTSGLPVHHQLPEFT